MAKMSGEEVRRAIMDPCLTDQDVWEVLEQYKPPYSSNPFTKENKEISLLLVEKRPQLMERMCQEFIEVH